MRRRPSLPCSLHGGKDQSDRESTIVDYKANVCNILVATSGGWVVWGVSKRWLVGHKRWVGRAGGSCNWRRDDGGPWPHAAPTLPTCLRRGPSSRPAAPL